MSLDLSAGVVAFKNAAGGVNWSSSDKNLLLTNTINSSFNINAKNASSGAIVQTETTNLGAVAANASVIMGNYIVDGNVFTIGGDRFYLITRERMINLNAYQTYLTGTSMPARAVWFRLDITGGNLVATVNYRIPLLGASTPATTVQVRALIGGFEF